MRSQVRWTGLRQRPDDSLLRHSIIKLDLNWYIRPARLSEAPLSARSPRNPFAGNANAAAAGHKLFIQHCAECHGANGYGIGHAANLHVPGVQGTFDGSLFWVLRNGRIRRGMPSWSQLPDQQLWEIVTYVRTFKIK